MRRRRFECAALVVLAPHFVGSRSVEEWQVSNARAVHGAWRISELQLFSDVGCSKKLQPVNGSSYSSHSITEKVPVLTPAQNAGKDCVEPCGGKSGFCEWCGAGNACCRKGFQSDPQECRQAQGFSTQSQHECVSVPAEAVQTSSGGYKIFDGAMSTWYQADCPEKEGCGIGAVKLGGALLKENAQVRCVLVSQRRDDAVHGADVVAKLFSRPALPQGSLGCPGACHSGRYLEGSKDGVCKEYLSPHGWCGSGTEFSKGGVDCRACVDLATATARAVFRVASREMLEDGQVMVSRLKDSSSSNLWKSAPADVLHAGEDCWGPCISGYCGWCGEGHACCKSGSDSDLPECADATGFVALSHHECVSLIRGSASIFDGLLPEWCLAAAFIVPWVAIGAAMFCYVCRRACCRRKDPNPEVTTFKPLSGDVFNKQRQRRDNTEDDLRKKVLREQAKKLDWLT